VEQQFRPNSGPLQRPLGGPGGAAEQRGTTGDGSQE